MIAWRPLLLALCLFAAQLAAGMHALEHAASKEPLPNHVCELCLAGHDLGSGLTAALPALPVASSPVLAAVVQKHGRASLPPPPASQRAPPFA